MKKRYVMLIVLLCIAILPACGRANNEVPTTEPTTTAVPEVFETEEVPSTTVQEFNSIGEIPEATVVVDDREVLENIVWTELKVGFGSYGQAVRVDGKTAYVTHTHPGWKLDALFARKQFLAEHQVTFHYEGVGALERYTPPVKDADFLQGDDWGMATPEMIEERTAIRGFHDGVLTIVVDDEFTIIVNAPKN